MISQQRPRSVSNVTESIIRLHDDVNLLRNESCLLRPTSTQTLEAFEQY